MIDSSRLRNLVSIQINTPTVTAQGERVDSWSEVSKVFAEIAPLEGREFYQAQQVNSEITTRITIRWVPLNISSRHHRIVFGAHTYEIISPPINTEMANRELVMMCKEIE